MYPLMVYLSMLGVEGSCVVEGRGVVLDIFSDEIVSFVKHAKETPWKR